MNADAETDSESPKKRGRIPQSAWPQILERHRAGATLSAIAREFSCTPSAISYIIRKAEAAGMEAASSAEGDVVETTLPPSAEEAEEEVAPVVEAAPAPKPPIAAERAPERPERLPLSERPRMHMPAPPAPIVPPRVAEPPARERPAVQVASGGRPEPAPPVDEVEGRLRETARVCLASYRGWRQTPGETSIQALSDAVHELRKALARIEIDMSASRREEQAIRPIPIPSHRASRRPL